MTSFALKTFSLLIASLFILIFFSSLSEAKMFSPALLEKLKIKSETSQGYQRDKFSHWSGSSNCDTRDKVLFRQNTAAGKRCGDASGEWYSVYDGATLFLSSQLDVDHRVPLAEAWRSGANRWTAGTRKRYANDLYRSSLVAVSASSNRSKSDSDPADWLPIKTNGYFCDYLEEWVATKYRWRLSVDRQEKIVLKRQMRKNCSNKALFVPNIKRANVIIKKVKKPKPKPGNSKTDPRFSTCGEAIDNGYGPYVSGRDPEYNWYRDSDSDGIVCES